MLELKQIESFYPEKLKPFKKNLLREYLQYKTLEIIFDSRLEDKLVFMGGTALRMVYDNTRFSEDLDFDNRGLDKRELEELSASVKRGLQREGYPVELGMVFKKAFTCNIKISQLLRDYGLTGHRAEKVLIKINAEPQQFAYKSDQVILNKFDVFLRINVVPADILLAQKIYATFNRRRPMGRDFYDVVFLLGRTKPNPEYVAQKLKIKDATDLKKRLLGKCDKFDFKQLAQDVEPFLFSPSDSKKVLHFCEYIEITDLGA